MQFYQYLHAIQFKPLPKPDQLDFICESLREGQSVPFLARYRQPQTGGLEGHELRQIERFLKQHTSLEGLRIQCLKIREEQPAATSSWRDTISNAVMDTSLREFIKLFGTTRKTLATEARENGLEPLAKELLNRSRKQSTKIDPRLYAKLAPQKAMEGAENIVMEIFASDPELRNLTRTKLQRFGKIRSKFKKDAQDNREKFRDYYDFEAPVGKLKSYQFLALHRGSSEKILQVQIYPDDSARLIHDLGRKLDLRGKAFCDWLTVTLEKAFKKKILPSIQRELMSQLRNIAHEDALQNFENNLQSLLLTPGLNIDEVLAIDPGFANGCKWAYIQNNGNILQVGVLMLQNSKNWSSQVAKILPLLQKANVIAVGNGVGSHNCLDFLEYCRKDHALATPHLVVPEAGASVYSASDLANQELGDYKIELRGAISLGRRLFKPLEEYLKIPPMALGVGMYQHDLEESILHERLVARAKDVLHEVGLDLNQADTTSLELIAGIGPARARAITQFKIENGKFKNRQQLLNVTGFGPKSFEQAAGFCRVMESTEILDQTCVHPQDYADCHRMLQAISMAKLALPEYRNLLKDYTNWNHLSNQTGIAVDRLKHLKMCLVDYCLDPRDELPQPILRQGLRAIEDLKPGEPIQGVIRNVVDFGVFVDLGIQQDGLLHRSCYPDKHYETSLKPGKTIRVVIKAVDLRRQRIALELDSTIPTV